MRIEGGLRGRIIRKLGGQYQAVLTRAVSLVELDAIVYYVEKLK